jgi:uncharacterized protein YjbI with pentapeptide repeats
LVVAPVPRPQLSRVPAVLRPISNVEGQAALLAHNPVKAATTTHFLDLPQLVVATLPNRLANPLYRTHLRYANLTEANLSGAFLYEADLTKADLTRADLGRANLRGANLREANLSRAKLFVIRTNFSRANFTGATNLTQQQIELAQGNEHTQLPEHLERPASWSQSHLEQPTGDG